MILPVRPHGERLTELIHDLRGKQFFGCCTNNCTTQEPKCDRCVFIERVIAELTAATTQALSLESAMGHALLRAEQAEQSLAIRDKELAAYRRDWQIEAARSDKAEAQLTQAEQSLREEIQERDAAQNQCADAERFANQLEQDLIAATQAREQAEQARDEWQQTAGDYHRRMDLVTIKLREAERVRDELRTDLDDLNCRGDAE